jgi:hypothetical protein
MAKQKKIQLSEPVYGVPGIPDALRVVIEHERDNIGNALVVLQCISLALDAVAIPLDAPFFQSAVDAVVAMLDRTHEALDPGVIEETLKTAPERLPPEGHGANVP